MPRFGWRLLSLTAGTLTLTLFMFTSYTWLWESTTGRPYTYIMRDHPWLLPFLALPAASALVARVPFTWRGRVTVVWLVGLVMFLAGHVYW